MSGTSTGPALATAFTTIIRQLRTDVIGRANLTRLPRWLILLINLRLTRIIERFVALLNNPPKPRKPRETTTARTRNNEAAEPSPERLPHQFAWLARLVPHSETTINATAPARAEFVQFLANPALATMLETNPAAGRTLRPLCHMLGIKPPDFLRLPPRQREPNQTPTPRKPRRKNPPRPDLFPTPPRNPTPWEQQQAFLRMFARPDFEG